MCVIHVPYSHKLIMRCGVMTEACVQLGLQEEDGMKHCEYDVEITGIELIK